jgi:hypothetical protein
MFLTSRLAEHWLDRLALLVSRHEQHPGAMLGYL